MSTTLELKLYDALKRITQYQSPAKLHAASIKLYGLDGDEAIEYAYENVLAEAASAIKGVRRPRHDKPAGKAACNPSEGPAA